MPQSHRSALTAVLAAAAAAAVLCNRAGPPARPVPPPGDAGAAPGENWPDPEIRQCTVRAAARRIVARGVIAGRVSPAEAAAVFAALNELPPRSPFGPLPAEPGGERGENLHLGLQVVRWVAVVAEEEYPDGPGELATATECAVRCGGVVELPTVGGPALRELWEAAAAAAAQRSGPVGPATRR
jgi:hypothetical protein